MPGRKSWTFKCVGPCGKRIVLESPTLAMRKHDVRWQDALWREGWYTEDGLAGLKCPECRKPEQPRKIRTGDDVKHLGVFMMLPTAAGTCAECAGNHAPGEPHNKDSLAYQYAFFGKHGRWPTWEDAFAHCPKETQEAWREALKERGVATA